MYTSQLRFRCSFLQQDAALLVAVCRLCRMVRCLAAGLVEVGHGHMTPAQFKKVLAAGDRAALTVEAAPPHGLYLKEVRGDCNRGVVGCGRCPLPWPPASDYHGLPCVMRRCIPFALSDLAFAMGGGVEFSVCSKKTRVLPLACGLHPSRRWVAWRELLVDGSGVPAYSVHSGLRTC